VQSGSCAARLLAVALAVRARLPFHRRRAESGVWLGICRWPSAEIAEQKALDWMVKHRDTVEVYGITFLGALRFDADDQR
jgi:hypothetical protein